ncbi:MAG: hypothetical protein DHS20C01_13010 [marine bacterium B5-7]|nr:MAG: hypothetical protein DHS20C01_13010 [marine bacterium B5-7]
MRYHIDSHVHIYPFYRVETTLESLIDNMTGSDDHAVRLGCLTERHDCFLFDRIASGEVESVNRSFEINRLNETMLELVRFDGGASLYLVAGQQIVTAENIEILALNTTRRVADGLSAANTVTSVLESDGLPVIAWAPGKWFLSRGSLVRSLLDEFSPQEIALGDTSLRPRGWLTPFIMRTARQRGFRILIGSDPLPVAGEECRAGCVYSRVEVSGEIDCEPVDIMKRLLSIPVSSIRSDGRRLSPITVARRLLAHSNASSKSKH